MSTLPISASAPVCVNSVEITPLVVNGQRVLTLAMIDTIHARPEGTAGRNFRENRHRLIEGEDYFEVCVDEIRRHKILELSSMAREAVIFFTESGYLLLVKSFTDDLAWRIQRELVNAYFRTPISAQPSISDRLLSARFILTFAPDGRAQLTEAQQDAFVLPASDWPKVIATPDFPVDLLPRVLAAVSERMQAIQASRAAPTQVSPPWLAERATPAPDTLQEARYTTVIDLVTRYAPIGYGALIGHITKAFKVRGRTAQRLISDLTAAGRIVGEKHGRRTLYHLP